MSLFPLTECCRHDSSPGVSVSCFYRHILVWVEVKDNKRFLSYFVCDSIQPQRLFHEMALQLTQGAKIAGKKFIFLKSNGYVICSSANYFGRGKIGNREVVGFGLTGAYEYFDRMDFPYPSIRFREIKGDLLPLKEKEKADWKKLTIDEKKALYRASFCRTFSECAHSSDGEWKSIAGGTLLIVSFALWIFIMLKKYVLGPLPESTRPEWKERQLAYYVQLRVDPIDGLASLYDYEKDEWKPEAAKKWYQFWR